MALIVRFPEINDQGQVLAFFGVWLDDDNNVLGADEVVVGEFSREATEQVLSQLRSKLAADEAQALIGRVNNAIQESAKFSAVAKRNAAKIARFLVRRAIPGVGQALLAADLVQIFRSQTASSPYRSVNGEIPVEELPDAIMTAR